MLSAKHWRNQALKSKARARSWRGVRIKTEERNNHKRPQHISYWTLTSCSCHDDTILFKMGFDCGCKIIKMLDIISTCQKVVPKIDPISVATALDKVFLIHQPTSRDYMFFQSWCSSISISTWSSNRLKGSWPAKHNFDVILSALQISSHFARTPFNQQWLWLLLPLCDTGFSCTAEPVSVKRKHLPTYRQSKCLLRPNSKELTNIW